jgi:chemotaxis signal transduction protein
VSEHASPLAQRAAELRRNFDRSFAEPPRLRRAASIDLLALRMDGDGYALRLSAVAGLFADKKLTRLPSAVPEFLGIAGFRGAVVPVYDLRVLLGHGAGEVPRWLVVAAIGQIAFAFDALDGTLRLPLAAVASQGPGEPVRLHVRELVRTATPGAPLRSLIDLDSVVAAVKQRVRHTTPNP